MARSFRTPLVLALAALSVAGGASAHTNSEPVDRAVGNGQVVADVLRPNRVGDEISFQAAGFRNGTITGFMRYRPMIAAVGGSPWDGTVTCLSVNGKLALLGGRVDNPVSGMQERFSLMIRNTIDMDLREDPVVLRYGPTVAGDCSEGDLIGVPVVYLNVSGWVHDGQKTTIYEDLGLPVV